MALPDSGRSGSPLKRKFEEEGNYASSAQDRFSDQDMISGLTLPPKIQSNNVPPLDLASSGDGALDLLGPLRMDLIGRDVVRDDSWMHALMAEEFPHLQPPSKRRKLNHPSNTRPSTPQPSAETASSALEVSDQTQLSPIVAPRKLSRVPSPSDSGYGVSIPSSRVPSTSSSNGSNQQPSTGNSSPAITLDETTLGEIQQDDGNPNADPRPDASDIGNSSDGESWDPLFDDDEPENTAPEPFSNISVADPGSDTSGGSSESGFKDKVYDADTSLPSIERDFTASTPNTSFIADVMAVIRGFLSEDDPVPDSESLQKHTVALDGLLALFNRHPVFRVIACKWALDNLEEILNVQSSKSSPLDKGARVKDPEDDLSDNIEDLKRMIKAERAEHLEAQKLLQSKVHDAENNIQLWQKSHRRVMQENRLLQKRVGELEVCTVKLNKFCSNERTRNYFIYREHCFNDPAKVSLSIDPTPIDHITEIKLILRNGQPLHNPYWVCCLPYKGKIAAYKQQPCLAINQEFKFGWNTKWLRREKCDGCNRDAQYQRHYVEDSLVEWFHAGHSIPAISRPLNAMPKKSLPTSMPFSSSTAISPNKSATPNKAPQAVREDSVILISSSRSPSPRPTSDNGSSMEAGGSFCNNGTPIPGSQANTPPAIGPGITNMAYGANGVSGSSPHVPPMSAATTTVKPAAMAPVMSAVTGLGLSNPPVVTQTGPVKPYISPYPSPQLQSQPLTPHQSRQLQLPTQDQQYPTQSNSQKPLPQNQFSFSNQSPYSYQSPYSSQPQHPNQFPYAGQFHHPGQPVYQDQLLYQGQPSNTTPPPHTNQFPFPVQSQPQSLAYPQYPYMAQFQPIQPRGLVPAQFTDHTRSSNEPLLPGARPRQVGIGPRTKGAAACVEKAYSPIVIEDSPPPGKSPCLAGFEIKAGTSDALRKALGKSIKPWMLAQPAQREGSTNESSHGVQQMESARSPGSRDGAANTPVDGSEADGDFDLEAELEDWQQSREESKA